MDEKMVILVGAVCVVEGWNLICLTCNTFTLCNAKLPSNTPHLLEPSTSINLTIQNPTDDECGIFGDVTGATTENLSQMTKLTQNQCLGETCRMVFVIRDALSIGSHLYLLCSTVAKLYFGYHPFIWRLTARITEDSVYRALCYFAFDNFLNRCRQVPIHFLIISLTEPSTFSTLQLNLTWHIILSLWFASLMYLWINVIEIIGIAGCSLIRFAMGIAELLVSTIVIFGVKRRPPPPLPDDLNASLRALCVNLEYPDMIFRETIKAHFPLIRYLSTLFNDVVIFSPQLMKRLSNDNMVALVTHELGKKRYWYWPLFYLSFFAKSAAVCYICLKTYDNIEIDEMFGFLDDLPHPIVSLYLANTYIMPLIMQVIDWISHFVNRRYIYWCDYFACSLGYSTALKSALLALAGTSNRYPFLDGRWYSIFMYSVPRVEDRVLKIDLYDFLNSRQP